MPTELEFKLHENQAKVWESPSRYRVLVAGRRFGKTTLAVVELIISALSKPDSLLWYVSPTYRQSKMICWKLLQKLLPPELTVKKNESELSVQFANGSIIELKGADNRDSLRGTGLDGIVIDEFASIYDNWAVWNEILRPSLADKKGWVLFIGTPKGKDAFYELWVRGERKDRDWHSWRFKTTDNPFIDPKEIEDAKLESPERYFRQEFEASFEDFHGLIYPEFKHKYHVVDPIKIPKGVNRVAAIDPAITGTTGVLKCFIDEDGDLYIYSEYYEKNKRVSEIAERIQEDDIFWIIDPSALKRGGTKEGKLYSLYNEFSDYGISPYLAEKDVDAGINRTGEYFKRNRIKIFKNCTNLIWELERYHWSEVKETIKGETKAKPFKKDDHLADCLRYIIMSRPTSPRFEEEQKIEKGSVAYDMMQDEMDAKNWRLKYQR